MTSDLFSTDDPAAVARLETAGWRRIHYWGSLSWQSPDRQRLTQYTATAIAWLEEDEAKKGKTP